MNTRNKNNIERLTTPGIPSAIHGHLGDDGQWSWDSRGDERDVRILRATADILMLTPEPEEKVRVVVGETLYLVSCDALRKFVAGAAYGSGGAVSKSIIRMLRISIKDAIRAKARAASTVSAQAIGLAVLLGLGGCFEDPGPGSDTVMFDEDSGGSEDTEDTGDGDGDETSDSSMEGDGDSTDGTETDGETDGETESTDTGTPDDWALMFYGAEQGVSAPIDSSLNSEFTVELWLEIGSDDFYGVMLDTRNVGWPDGWVWFIGRPGIDSSPYRMTFSYSSVTINQGIVGPELLDLDDGWHHFAVVRRADGLLTYFIDGEPATTQMTDAPPLAGQPSAFNLGRYALDVAATDLWWRGAAIDDVHVSQSARYLSPFTPMPAVDDSDSALLWRFDEGAGTVAADDVSGVELALTGVGWVLGN